MDMSSTFVNNKEEVNTKIFERNFINVSNKNTIMEFNFFPNSSRLNDNASKDNKVNQNIFNSRIMNNENHNKLAKVGFINFKDDTPEIIFDRNKLSDHINKYL